MPKSASTYLTHLQKEAVYIQYNSTGQEAFLRAVNDGSIKGVGGFVTGNSFDRNLLENLLQISNQHGPFIAKAHVRLNDALGEYIIKGKVKCTYSIRNPNDIVLSGMDSYKKEPYNFESFHNLSSAVKTVEQYCKTAITWKDSGLVKIVKYEKLISDTSNILDDIFDYFALNITSEELVMIISRANEIQKNKNTWSLRFNKGMSKRYLLEMSKDDISLCDSSLGCYFSSLGYGSDLTDIESDVINP